MKMKVRHATLRGGTTNPTLEMSDVMPPLMMKDYVDFF